MNVGKCGHCGEPFFVYREGQRFGSPRCRRAAWTVAQAAEASQERLAPVVRCRRTVFYPEAFPELLSVAS